MAQTRRGLTASLAALIASAPAASAADDAARSGEKATPADYASVEFEPVPGLAESMGSREEWLTKMGDRYPTLYLGAATMRKTRDEVTDMATRGPDAVAELIKCLLDLSEHLEAERDVMRTAAVRLLAGACRAGLV